MQVFLKEVYWSVHLQSTHVRTWGKWAWEKERWNSDTSWTQASPGCKGIFGVEIVHQSCLNWGKRTQYVPPSSPLLESLGRIITLGRTPPFSKVQFWRGKQGKQRWNSVANTPGKGRNKCLCPGARVWTGYYTIHLRSQSPIDRILDPGPWKTPLLSKSNGTTATLFAFALLNKTSGLPSALYLIMLQNTSFVYPKVKASGVSELDQFCH